MLFQLRPYNRLASIIDMRFLRSISTIRMSGVIILGRRVVLVPIPNQCIDSRSDRYKDCEENFKRSPDGVTVLRSRVFAQLDPHDADCD